MQASRIGGAASHVAITWLQVSLATLLCIVGTSSVQISIGFVVDIDVGSRIEDIDDLISNWTHSIGSPLLTSSVQPVDFTNNFLTQRIATAAKDNHNLTVVVVKHCSSLYLLTGDEPSQAGFALALTPSPCTQPPHPVTSAHALPSALVDFIHTAGWTEVIVLYSTEYEHVLNELEGLYSSVQWTHTRVNLRTALLPLLEELTQPSEGAIAFLILTDINTTRHLLNQVSPADTALRRQGYISHLSQWLLVLDNPEHLVSLATLTTSLRNVDVIIPHPEVDTALGFIADCLPHLTNIIANISFGLSYYTSGGSVGSIRVIQGSESNARLFDFHAMTSSGSQSVGYWTPPGELHVVGERLFPCQSFGFNGKQLTVGVLHRDPYSLVMDNGTLTMSGFLMDFLSAIANELNFTYELRAAADEEMGVYASMEDRWTGLIGMVTRGEVDFVLAPISISHDRENVIDFTYPFHVDQYAVLYKRIDPASMKWRLFMEPFRWLVWLGIASSMLITALCVCLVTRWSPFYNQEEQTTGLGAFSASLMFTYGSLCQQGALHQPRSLSARFITGFWWMFAVAIVATYTGNLIAFLTVSIDFKPFSSVDEMVHSKMVKYGFVGGTVMESILKEANDSLYREMWREIMRFNETDSEVLDRDPNVHIDKVLNEGYAFLADKTTLDVAVRSYCGKLNQLEQNIWLTQYGVGLPEGSAYTTLFSERILQFHETGFFSMWRARYFVYGAGRCVASVSLTKPATFWDVQGPLILLGMCLLVCGIIFMLEIAFSKRYRIRAVTPDPCLITPDLYIRGSCDSDSGVTVIPDDKFNTPEDFSRSVIKSEALSNPVSSLGTYDHLNQSPLKSWALSDPGLTSDISDDFNKSVSKPRELPDNDGLVIQPSDTPRVKVPRERKTKKKTKGHLTAKSRSKGDGSERGEVSASPAATKQVKLAFHG